jgi:heat shock protein HslJ
MKYILLSLVVLMCFLGTSCQKQVVTPEVLMGKEWRLTDWSASSLHPADFMITANFTKDIISGKSAVNQYNGPYTLTKNSGFSVGVVAMTMMAGSEDEMSAEQIYHELLNKAKKYELNPSSLRLLDENGNELLIFAWLHK